MKRTEITAIAREFLEVPWRHQGRTRTAVDCIGLVCCVGDHFGIPYEDIDGYSRNPDGRFVAHLKKYLTFRVPQKVAEGSVVILRDAHHPCHVGIITVKHDQFYLLHASAQKRAVVEEEWNQVWSTRLRCVMDFPGVED